MKTKLLKKMLSLMVAGTVAFSLAACSSGTESESTGSDQMEETTASQETTETADTAQVNNTEESAELL